MFNSSKETLDFGDARMMARLQRLGVPDTMLQMGGILEKALAPFALLGNERRERKKKDDPAGQSLWVNSPVDGYCGVCGVATVEGPGRGSCLHADSCNGFAPPLPGLGKLDE